MEEVKLEVELREQTGTRKVQKLRREDFIPAVVYGGEKGPTSIKIQRRPFEKIMRGHAGQSIVFHLDVIKDGKKLRDYSAIIKDEQFDPVRDHIIHLDFQRIALNKEIEMIVPIDLRGEAPGVQSEGGTLDQPMRELNVVCLPANVPEKIIVDVSGLSIGQSIHVQDLKLPEGVGTHHDAEDVVASVTPPMREESASAEEQPEEPEVIGAKPDKNAAAQPEENAREAQESSKAKEA